MYGGVGSLEGIDGVNCAAMVEGAFERWLLWEMAGTFEWERSGGGGGGEDLNCFMSILAKEGAVIGT